jgi:hypothetical protein
MMMNVRWKGNMLRKEGAPKGFRRMVEGFKKLASPCRESCFSCDQGEHLEESRDDTTSEVNQA